MRRSAIRKVRTYSVATMVKTLKEAMKTAERGLKVIIADGECQLARQRRVRAEEAEKLKRGARVVRVRYGVDDEICTGDHSCIRLSACPSLTVKPNPDPLRSDPVATVVESCVGCGLCGEVAHAAVLCPSFYRAEIIRNPNLWDRALHRLRRTAIGWMMHERATSSPPPLWGRDREGGELQAPRSPSTPLPNPPPQGGREHAVPRGTAETTARPLTLLIAALGGEGGGVLTNWIIAAAADCGFPTQSTSIPGVAQRTGATTYYIEIVPKPWRELAGRRPVLALTPGIGDIDVVVASELMEASRAVASGFVTPDRTLMVASTSRFFTVNEKIAMGDGRYDSERLTKAIGEHAQASLLFDMEALAKESGTIISAVMLGAIAGCGRLPIPPEAFEAAIRADGKSVEGNLRGFRAGLEAAREGSAAPAREDGKRGRPQATDIRAFGREIAARMPAAAGAMINEGVRRLAAYQDFGYVRLYLDRLAVVREADARAGANGRLLSEVARHLAVRMSYEDVIRVAQAKVDPARMRRIGEEMKVAPGEPYAVVEFLKPGIEEMCSDPAAVPRAAHSAAGGTAWLARPLGHGDQEHVDQRLSALLAARQAAALAAAQPSLSGRAGGDRGLAWADRGSLETVRRSRDRNRRVRALDQGLRRHAQARQRKLRA